MASGMTPAEAMVTLPETAVMYAAGKPGRPFPEQAADAFCRLEARLASLKGRKFYGAVLGDEYRACVALRAGDTVGLLPHPVWMLPGGKYVRRRIPDWEQNRHLIGATVAELRRRADNDPSRPCIEFYRSRRELLILVPMV